MKKFNQIFTGFKLFVIISLSTGILIILFSILGHFFRSGNLIPYSMVGGSIGILTGVYFLYKLGLIKGENVLDVSVCSLIPDIYLASFVY